MKEFDDITSMNRHHWEKMVQESCGFTRPWLDLNLDIIEHYATGQHETVKEPLLSMYPSNLLKNVKNKNVLCLASGGGQQSAVFGLLGAKVTVVDFSEGQLEGDRKAAAHYGYNVIPILADMRDLSSIGNETFDLVYQGESMCYIPDVQPLYSEVARVLKTGGVYRVSFANPATEFVDWNSWEGEGYLISKPYAERSEYPKHGEEGSIQFMHHFKDIFNRLIHVGLSIQEVQDSPHYFSEAGQQAQPGSWDHWQLYAGSFAIVARK